MSKRNNPAPTAPTATAATDPADGPAETGNAIPDTPEIQRVPFEKLRAAYVASGDGVYKWLKEHAEVDDTGSYWYLDPATVAWCDELQVPGRVVNGADVVDLVPDIARRQVNAIVILIPKTASAPPVVVTGHRRHMACAILNQPVKVVPYLSDESDWVQGALESIASENVQRAGLSVPQLAAFAARCIPKGRRKGADHPVNFAKAIGKSEHYAWGLAGIGRDMSPKVLEAWISAPSKLTYDSARKLAKLRPLPLQWQVFNGELSYGEAAAKASGDATGGEGGGGEGGGGGDPKSKRPTKKALEAALSEASRLAKSEDITGERRASVVGFEAALRLALGYTYDAPVAELDAQVLSAK